MAKKVRKIFLFILALLIVSYFGALLIFSLNNPAVVWDWDKVDTSDLAFPHDFVWGVATAAHQVEGNCTNNNWYKWESAVDVDGNPRITNNIVDMGAYEFSLSDSTQLLEFLAQDITDLGLQHGIANNLLAKLNSALQILEDENQNNDDATVNILRAFINNVEAQAGKKISSPDADAIITAAQQIIDLLSNLL